MLGHRPCKVCILNKKGENLVGVLEDNGSSQIIILCHGFRSSKENGVLTNLSSGFLSMGFSTFRFDFSGSGESEGNFQYGSYWKDAEDLRSVVSHWRDQGRKVAALVGHSKGGNAVLLYLSKYKDVGTVVNICGRFYLKNGIKERLGKNYMQIVEEDGYLDVKDRHGSVEYRVTKESLKERLNTDMETAMKCVPNSCSVLTVHGSNDETVDYKEAGAFDRLIPNHILQIIVGADHYFRKHRQSLNSIVLAFVKARLTSSVKQTEEHSCVHTLSRL